MRPISQLAWVTDDLDECERLVAAELGAGKWTRLPNTHFGPDACTYHGGPADFVACVSLTYVGDLQLELIQPVSGTSIYNDEPRPTHVLHHVCHEVDDLAAAVAATGRPVLQGGSMMGGEVQFAYVANEAPGIPYLELIQLGPQARAFYDIVKQRSQDLRPNRS